MTLKDKTKSMDVEKEQRIEKIYTMLIDSCSRYQILKFTKETWNIERSMADNYIKWAKEKIVEEAQQTIEEFHQDSKNKFKRLYRLAMKNKDFREARQIIETMNTVLGYAKINVVSVPIDTETLPKADRERILKQIGLLKDN
jgi:hypothetical protein